MSSASVSSSTSSSSSSSSSSTLLLAEIMKKRVPEIKEKMRELGLVLSGRKADLALRLCDALTAQGSSLSTPTPTPTTTTTSTTSAAPIPQAVPSLASPQQTTTPIVLYHNADGGGDGSSSLTASAGVEPKHSKKRKRSSSHAPPPSSASASASASTSASASASTSTSHPRVVEIDPHEKREAKYRTSATADVRQRITRALQERLYLISRKDNSSTRQYMHNFVVLGSTGNVYNVKITNVPTCTCPDFQKGHLCKHILFVWLKVLKVDRHSPIIYQKALLTSELASVLESPSARDLSTTVLANQNVLHLYEVATGEHVTQQTEDSQTLKTNNEGTTTIIIKQRPVEGDCPICYDDVKVGKVDWCRVCGNNVHVDCFTRWSNSQIQTGEPVTCVYCRSAWVSPKPEATSTTNEGYLNLADAAGVSRYRDSFYSSWEDRWMYRYHRHNRYRDYYDNTGYEDYDDEEDDSDED